MEYIYSSVKNCPCLNGKKLFILHLTSRTSQKGKKKQTQVEQSTPILLLQSTVLQYLVPYQQTCYQSTNNFHSNCQPGMSVGESYYNWEVA